MLVTLIIPLLMTTTAPTLFRIFFSTKTTIIKHDSSTQIIGKRRSIDLPVVQFVIKYTFSYMIPCLILLSYTKNDNISSQISNNEAIIDDLHHINQLRYTTIYTAIVWHPITQILSQWPQIISMKEQSKIPNGTIQSLLIHGGPLGYGCSEVIQVLVAVVLWKYKRGYIPFSILDTYTFIVQNLFSNYSNIEFIYIFGVTLTVLVLLSWIVDIVLWYWLQYFSKDNNNQNQNSHVGLQQMVQSTSGRTLYRGEQFRYAVLAIINATCEECTSRGFIRSELEITGGCTTLESNIVQGFIFGIWHYYGIPNGWSGVVLTTIYGWIMGYLSNWKLSARTNINAMVDSSSSNTTMGLLLPIITHSIADYYIFSVVARQQHERRRPN